MKNLIDRLENEVGLTHDQARISVGIFRDYLIESENDPDLVEMMRVKATYMAKSVKSKYDELNDQAEDIIDKAGFSINEITNKTGDKVDELLDKTKKKAKVVVDKISDYLDK